MILLVYPKYVGGKFISNCLALSRHCVVQDRKTALMDIKIGEHGFNDAYYKFKLAAVMKTLPLKQDMGQWGKYEYGCDKLYGIDEEFYKERSVGFLKDYVAKGEIYKILKDANRESCLITHDYRTLMKCLRVWPEARVIEFDYYHMFRASAAKLKAGESIVDTESYKQAALYNTADQNFYQLDSDFILEVDNMFYSVDVFCKSMKNIYEKFGFTDFNRELVSTFYNAYMSLHQ